MRELQTAGDSNRKGSSDHVETQTQAGGYVGAAGAAVGAGIGAAAGTAGAVLTGKGVEIPSETRFTYKLTQPVEIDLREISK